MSREQTQRCVMPLRAPLGRVPQGRPDWLSPVAFGQLGYSGAVDVMSDASVAGSIVASVDGCCAAGALGHSNDSEPDRVDQLLELPRNATRCHNH